MALSRYFQNPATRVVPFAPSQDHVADGATEETVIDAMEPTPVTGSTAGVFRLSTNSPMPDSADYFPPLDDDMLPDDTGDASGD